MAVQEGDNGPNIIRGRAGQINDTIRGRGGNDIISGGPLQDILIGGAGNDGLYGNEGNDILNGGTGGDVIRGGKDRDIINGEENNDLLFGQAGANSVTGGAGDDRLIALGETTLPSKSEDGIFIDIPIINNTELNVLTTRENKSFLDLGNRSREKLYYDELTGGTGADTFHLQRNSDVQGQAFLRRQKFAIIKDFRPGGQLDGDKIVLPGSPDDYRAELYGTDNNGTVIYYTADPDIDISFGVGVLGLGTGVQLEIPDGTALVAILDNVVARDMYNLDFYEYTGA